MSIENDDKTVQSQKQSHKRLDPAYVHRQMKIHTYLRGLKNPPKTTKAMIEAATQIDAILKAFQECEDQGISFRELSTTVQDLRFEMKALNNLIKPYFDE